VYGLPVVAGRSRGVPGSGPRLVGQVVVAAAAVEPAEAAVAQEEVALAAEAEVAQVEAVAEVEAVIPP
jgi:hypothetical protein